MTIEELEEDGFRPVKYLSASGDDDGVVGYYILRKLRKGLAIKKGFQPGYYLAAQYKNGHFISPIRIDAQES